MSLIFPCLGFYCYFRVLNKETMKKIAYIFVALFATLLGVACSKPAPTPPDEVAVKLYNAITSGDITFVKKHLHFSNPVEYEVFCDYLDMALRSDEYWERTEGYKADYRVLDTKIYGSEAYVELQGETPLNGTATMTVHLLFIDGKWKVDGNHGVLHRN